MRIPIECSGMHFLPHRKNDELNEYEKGSIIKKSMQKKRSLHEREIPLSRDRFL